MDILSFLPYYLPIFFPSGAVAFRMFRVARFFRLFRINACYDSLNVINEVISRQTIIIIIKRRGKVLIPRGDLVMQEGDKVIMYTQTHISHAQQFQI